MVLKNVTSRWVIDRRGVVSEALVSKIYSELQLIKSEFRLLHCGDQTFLTYTYNDPELMPMQVGGVPWALQLACIVDQTMGVLDRAKNLIFSDDNQRVAFFDFEAHSFFDPPELSFTRIQESYLQICASFDVIPSARYADAFSITSLAVRKVFANLLRNYPSGHVESALLNQYSLRMAALDRLKR
jgi:hypothetical protein